MTERSPARAGRRTGESTARDDILTAARKLFGSNGFKSTTMRAVATEAGVDVALVPYYFGSKYGLFVAALELPIDPAESIRRATDCTRSELGTRLISTFTGVWEDPETGPVMQGLLRSVINDEGLTTAFGDFASNQMVPILTESAEISTPTARAVLSTLFGIATLRYLIRIPAFTQLTRDELIASHGPRLQAVIDVDR
ncbi:TetR/AcrR family transcriptional regulator [Gordonia zhaorongruii]|uniref:TetR/AcrR family transcriptional regulator n=1 Tax=Gordonia zhaorongruii TaxID=2597659 RepID=UPI00104C800D|nr:TetR family transcriptional regulator [Gordonia zhaorongruii]